MDEQHVERPRQNLPELFDVSGWQALAATFALSERERQVARLACRRQTNRQIGRPLEILPHTVGMHPRGVFAKLDGHDQVGMVVRLVLTDRDLRDCVGRIALG